MTEELSTSQKNVLLFKMYHQYIVYKYVYYIYEHIFVLHSMGMYHSASKLRQTGDSGLPCFIVCYEVTEILWMGFFFFFLVLLSLHER